MDRASSSSSSNRRWSFDVFLSFRGEDTRNFTSHLNMALRQRGINVVIDNNLSRGEKISPSLLEESKISIVIISEHYASSSWCLNELVQIMMCNELRGKVVLPIFYKVDPCQVRIQNGAFGEAFAKLEVRFFDMMQEWRDALTAVSHMSGWVVLQNDDEANLIQKIVEGVQKKLTRSTMQLYVTKYPVGINRQVGILRSYVMFSGSTEMVGLYGIGGMGKTTLAKALYNRIADDFEGCCFLTNIREASKQHEGLVRLQEKLLSEILMEDFIRVGNIYSGINIIKKRLRSKKILLILDDIDTSEQLQVLAGGYDWFGSGSKVIATTRNKQLLDIHGFNILPNVPELLYDEALELFSWYAFKSSCPPSDYLRLSIHATNYCKNLPLALTVLGRSFFYSADPSNFKRILDEFANSNLHKNIQDVLQVSYDGLEGDVQEMFLFISCFFVGEDKTMVKMMLEECGCLCWEKGITELMNLSLLTINKRNKVEMHKLIQQMGHTIARSNTSTSPSEKQLLVEDEAMYVLSENYKEARLVKAIKLDFPQARKLDIDSRAFEKVKNLVVLKVKNVTSSETTHLDFLPNSLRWMSWSKFPFSSFPSSYSMENLIQLKLPHSLIEDFGTAFLRCESLKQLDLSNSYILEEIPDLSAAINLEKLSLSGCVSLVKVDKSVGCLGKLVDLSLSSHVDGFKQFPSPLKLKSLKNLSTDHCTIVKGYPEFSEEMKSSLEELWFYSSFITELSSTIRYLTSLKDLTISDCRNLTTLPNTIYQLSQLTSIDVSQSDLSTFPSSYSCLSSLPHLTRLHLDETKITNLDFLETIAHVAPSLRVLNLSNNNFSRLPSCIVNFKSLRFLETFDCKLLEEIPKVPEGLISLNAEGCISLAKFPDNLADFISYDDSEHADGQFKQIILMNCDIPEWFSYKSMNNPITIFMPSNYPSWELKVFAPCVKFQVNHVDGDRWMDLECKVSINDIQVWSSEELPFLEESRGMLIEASPYEYTWLLVLYPHIDFQPNWDDIIERSQEINLHQQSFGINAMGRDNNNNYNVHDGWNYFGESIWRKFTVSFGVHPKFKDSIVSIKRCGVHVIMEE